MAYSPHTLVAFGGSLTDPGSGQAEIWECTVRGVQVDSPDRPVTDPVAFMNGIATPLSDWFSDGNSKNVQNASLLFLKVNNIGADGKYLSRTATNIHDYPTGITGGSPSSHPFTESFCYSWSTAVARGPGARGRIYPPNASTSNGASATCSQAEQNAFLLAARALLHLLNVGNGDTAGMLSVVASKVNATNTPITGIRIGRVVDSQRRRRSALTENYVTGLAYP